MYSPMYFPYFIEKDPILEKIGRITCSLELGDWTKDKIIAELIHEQTKYPTANQKIEYLTRKLLGSSSIYESILPILGEGMLRVRFASFDCTTFIYTLLALCDANDFEDFVERLYRLRYKTNVLNTINNNPLSGNIFDFVNESLLINGVRQGYIQNITNELLPQELLVPVSINLKRFRRSHRFDRFGYVVSPKLGEGLVTEYFISSSNIGNIDPSNLMSGDLALLTFGPTGKNGSENAALINHLVVILKEEQDVYFVHCTSSFAVKLDADDFSPTFTGIYYDNDPRKEQIGVGYGGEFAGNEFTVVINDIPYHGYYQNKKRTFISYVQENFYGAIFLRPLLKNN